VYSGGRYLVAETPRAQTEAEGEHARLPASEEEEPTRHKYRTNASNLSYKVIRNMLML